MRCGSKSTLAPSPWQSEHAPWGELNENARGVISGMLKPQSTHASRRENSRSPPARVLTTTMSSASVERRVDRFGEPPFDAASHDQAIDHDLDRVVAPPIERDVLVQRAELASMRALVKPRRAAPRALS
jgi:hypothetical protein